MACRELHLPLSGGGRRAQRAGWGSVASLRQKSFLLRDAPALGTCHLVLRELRCHEADLLKYAGHILDHIRIPEPENSDAPGRKPSIAALVALNLARKIVLSTIQLDRKTQPRAIEIKHIWSGGMSTPKLVAIDLPVAQSVPQTAFYIG
jgi:hypothetical protein